MQVRLFSSRTGGGIREAAALSVATHRAGASLTRFSWALVAPQLQTDRDRSEGEEVVLLGQKPCPPSRGAASSPGLRDICPASRPQTAAQSHVSTSTRESGNWLWPLREKEEEECGPPKDGFSEG